jgi:hypothetical protein
MIIVIIITVLVCVALECKFRQGIGNSSSFRKKTGYLMFLVVVNGPA